MTTELEAAGKALRRGEETVKNRRAVFHRLIVEARDAGTPQTQIAKQAGISREGIRLILKAHDDGACKVCAPE